MKGNVRQDFIAMEVFIDGRHKSRVPVTVPVGVANAEIECGCLLGSKVEKFLRPTTDVDIFGEPRLDKRL